MAENHDVAIGQLTKQLVVLKSDIHDLQEITKTVQVQLGKIDESQTLILTKFEGKPEPNPVVDLKMTRSSTGDDKLIELDYGNAPSPKYTVEDLVKMITLRNPGIEEGSNAATNQMFINQIAIKVRELEMEYKHLSEKLPAKLDDIFEPTIKIKIGTNEIAALCDLGSSVSTIPNSLFDRLNRGTFNITELKLHLSDSTYNKLLELKKT